MDKMENNYDTTKQGMVCPICGKEFGNVHDFAKHMNEHSFKEKATEKEEERKRLEDQRKYDKANLGKLYNAYMKAASDYLNAKRDYAKKYNEHTRSVYDILDELFKF